MIIKNKIIIMFLIILIKTPTIKNQILNITNERHYTIMGEAAEAMARKLNINNNYKLKDELRNDENDIILFVVGSAGVKCQELPDFFCQIAQEHPDLKFKIFSCDIKWRFENFEMMQSTLNEAQLRNIQLQRFTAYVGSSKQKFDQGFNEIFKEFLRRKANGKKIVFISNQTSPPSFSLVPELMYIWNELNIINSNFKKNIQLFTDLFIHELCSWNNCDGYYLFDKTNVEQDNLKIIQVHNLYPFQINRFGGKFLEVSIPKQVLSNARYYEDSIANYYQKNGLHLINLIERNAQYFPQEEQNITEKTHNYGEEYLTSDEEI